MVVNLFIFVRVPLIGVGVPSMSSISRRVEGLLTYRGMSCLGWDFYMSVELRLVYLGGGGC